MLSEKEKLVLITGGARSGKSRLAEELAVKSGQKTAYIATAAVYDAEMAERVRLHRERRPAAWQTVEETRDLAGALERLMPDREMVILDCLTFWLTNVLMDLYDESVVARAQPEWERQILDKLECFLAKAAQAPYRLLVVSNEVGLGLVPDNPLGRVFRDLAGRANQRVAQAADAVFFTVAGIPVKIKGSA